MYIDTTEDFQGLFGVVRGDIQDITVTGNIVNAGNQSGGIVGSAGGSTIIMNCHNQVTIYSEEGTSVGGVVGYIVPKASVLNCNNKGNITALGQQGEYQETYVGGIVGYQSCAIKRGPLIIYNNNQNSAKVSGNKYVAGILAYGEHVTVDADLWDTNKNWGEIVGDIYGDLYAYIA